jgi:hypothetical protein
MARVEASQSRIAKQMRWPHSTSRSVRVQANGRLTGSELLEDNQVCLRSASGTGMAVLG